MASSHRLKVGIDFGTTFSGVSWIDTTRPDEVNDIMKWPGTTRACVKVPSEISYTTTGKLHKWGYQIKPGEERISCFKLSLQSTHYTSASSPMVTWTKNLVTAKKPVDIVADYLCCLKCHLLETLRGSLGKAFLDATSVDYTLAVPAIWGDIAKELTLQAAENAGLGIKSTIKLISEPEAAATWALLKDINIPDLKVNNTFVVVDCGGITVNLISYEILKLEPFNVRECAKGTGGVCGSVLLNEGFNELVRSRLGTRFDEMKTIARNRMLAEWEQYIKRIFSNFEQDDIFACPISGIQDDPEMGIEDGDFNITRKEILGIFDPIIDQIIPLVQEQIDIVECQNIGKMGISFILLVGGFGASPYLFQRLEDEFKEGKRATPIEIHQPTDAWSAVSRGAAMGVRISGRRARRHYGIDCETNFIFGQHPLKNHSYNRYTGDAMCENWIKWYIKKGDLLLLEDEPIHFHFTQHVPIHDSLVFKNRIYCCEYDDPPQCSNEDDCSAVMLACTVTCDLNEIPKGLLTQDIGPDNETYYRINYALAMLIGSASLHFELEFGGKRYGKVDAHYL